MADVPVLTTYITEDELMALGSDVRVEVVDSGIDGYFRDVRVGASELK